MKEIAKCLDWAHIVCAFRVKRVWASGNDLCVWRQASVKRLKWFRASILLWYGEIKEILGVIVRKVISICIFLCVMVMPAMAFGYGEGGDIPMLARALHLLSNQARSDTEAALAECGDHCLESESYEDSMAPLYWDEQLGNVAQFYANLIGPKGCLQHQPPCTLKSDIAKNYPDKCDGSESCACEEGEITCGQKIGGTFERLNVFWEGHNKEHGGVAENLLYKSNLSDAVAVFGVWINEDGKVSTGHRRTILRPDLNIVGIGVNNKIATQDFTILKNKSIEEPISSGAVYTHNQVTTFAMHYYHAKLKVVRAAIVIGAEGCYKLELMAGANQNGVYSIRLDEMEEIASSACTPFYFEAELSDGSVARYPTTGSLLYGACKDQSWNSSEASGCLAGFDPEAGPTENTEDAEAAEAETEEAEEAPEKGNDGKSVRHRPHHRRHGMRKSRRAEGRRGFGERSRRDEH